MKSFDELTAKERFEVIEDLLKREIYPMLAMDAGGMDLLKVDGYDVHVQYQGACEGCPVSYTGTGEFIEYVLKTQIDPQIRLIIEE